jgi:hypothetical protein
MTKSAPSSQTDERLTAQRHLRGALGHFAKGGMLAPKTFTLL